jgi:hypothetical protein
MGPPVVTEVHGPDFMVLMENYEQTVGLDREIRC